MLAGRSTSEKQRQGELRHQNRNIDLEIFVNYVKGVEILLASFNCLHVSGTKYWYSILRFGALVIFGWGKLHYSNKWFASFSPN